MFHLPIPVTLVHARVNEEARVAELTDLAGQKLDSFRAVAEDDCLGDVELGKEGVQAVKLLSFLQEGVVLCESLQSQLIRDLDVLGVGDVALLELTNFDWICCTEKANLAVLRAHFQNLLHDLLELSRDQPINFIKNADLALVELGLPSLCQIQDSTRRCYHYVDCLAHSNDVLIDARSTRRHHALDALVLAEFLDN